MPVPCPPPPLNIDALRRELQARTPQVPVAVIETHISWVLLAPELAYKLKKPVQLGFLDFGTRQARQRFCEEEVRLNARLAPGLYLDVVPVFGTPGAPSFLPGAAVIDHAVRMRRFAAGALFSEKLAEGRLLPQDIDKLARRIAEFHAGAPAAGVSTAYGTPQAIESAVLGVLSALEAHEGAAPLAPLREWLLRQAVALRPVWEERRRGGYVRECHGDLHLANVTEWDGDVVAFDCIEFDPALRWIDVMSDVAFVVMDLLAHERRDLAFRFLDRWLERTGDHAGLAVLRHAVVYRAMVRALVARLRPAGREPAAGADYLACARRSAAPGDPRLLITHGVSGSGKTHVTGRLLELAGAVRVRSDVERKRLFGLQALQRSAGVVADGIYGAQATERTFATLRERARVSLLAGHPTIVDAAFLRRHERASFEALARELQVPFAILHCHAGGGVLRQRVQRRRQEGADASEADVDVLERQLATREPLSARESARAIDVDSSGTVDIEGLWKRWSGTSS